MRRFRPARFAASELEIRRPLADDHEEAVAALLRAFDGVAVLAVDRAHAALLAAAATTLSNALDYDLEGGHVPAEELRPIRAARDGLTGLSVRLYGYAEGGRAR